MKFLLVGQQFSQGAPAILAKGLPQRAWVRLVPEPENPYDPLAVRVAVDCEAVVESPELADALAAFGLSVGALIWPFQLGHLGASFGTKAAKAALAADVHFHPVKEWHALAEPGRLSGRLTFEGFGPITVDVEADKAANEPWPA